MRILVLSLLFATVPFFVGAQDQPATQNQPNANAPVKKQFSSARLEQLVAPIALYPDSLLAQVLAASTYPVDIVEAARWVKNNPNLSQDDLKNQIRNRKWDPSVKGLVFFPQLLAKMNNDLDWTKDLGDAFLAQQKDVMDTVQVMRAKAKDAGTLNTDSNQNVNSAQDGGGIQIQSADPDTVYVQNYVPSTAYGTSWGNNNVNGYYPEVIATPSWPWGYCGGGWALGYNCAWNNGRIGYNNNYNNNYYNNHFINPNQYNSHNLYNSGNQNNPANREWSHNDWQSRTGGSSRQLDAGDRSYRGEDGAASGELRQAQNENARRNGEGSRTTEAARDLQNSERGEGGHSNNFSHENPNHAFSGTRNAGFDQSYSSRGQQSRSHSSGEGYHSAGGYHGGGGSHGGGGGGGHGGGGGRR